MQRVVSRSDLRSEEDSTPEPAANDNIKQFKEVEFEQKTRGDAGNTGEIGAGDDEELEFQLFRRSKATESSQTIGNVPKIRLRSPSLDKSKAGFTQPTRDPSYYFKGPLSTEQKENLEAAAVTGQQVLSLSRTPQPGNAYPWKLLLLPASNLHKSIRNAHVYGFRKLVDDTAKTRRTRPGKKYRVKLRTKQAALKARKEAAKVAEDAKEVAEREKRTRRNREKKVKKRARNKAKKASGADAEATADQHAGSEEASGSDDG